MCIQQASPARTLPANDARRNRERDGKVETSMPKQINESCIPRSHKK